MTARKPPPKKIKGQGTGPRTINGEILDIQHGATFLGVTDDTLRARVARREVPFRRWKGRIIFIRSELLRFVDALPGKSLEALLKENRE